MQNLEILFRTLVAWMEWLLRFARAYANYIALILLLIAGSKMFKMKANVNVGKS